VGGAVLGAEAHYKSIRHRLKGVDTVSAVTRDFRVSRATERVVSQDKVRDRALRRAQRYLGQQLRLQLVVDVRE
jgi:hypothetical protein